MAETTFKKVKLTEIKPNPINPKKHWDEGIEKSIADLGYLDPIEVDEKMVILAGHGRFAALKKAGVKEVPVVIHTGLTPKQKKRYLISNNQLTMREGWVDDLLRGNFEMEELLQAGFDNKTLKELYKEQDEEDDFDAEDELSKIKKPKAKVGDIYELGRHRIMCGDSTSAKDVKKLMGGGLADMVFTDPPYNVDYSGRGKSTSNKILNDNMKPEEFSAMLTMSFAEMARATKETAPAYVCYASRTHREFENALEANHYKVKNQIIWVKSLASMGWGDYRWKHEPILYVSREGKKVQFFGDRSEYTEWKEELNDKQLLKMIKRNIEREEKGESTVWRLKRETKYDHPTQKPLQLVRIAIWNSSKADDIVLDLFLGSGSTLIAAEETSRSCYGMELDPKYVDVIIKRWEKQTKEKATKVSS